MKLASNNTTAHANPVGGPLPPSSAVTTAPSPSGAPPDVVAALERASVDTAATEVASRAQLFDLEEEKSKRIVSYEALQIERGMAEVLRLRGYVVRDPRPGPRKVQKLSDDELVAIWARGM